MNFTTESSLSLLSSSLLDEVILSIAGTFAGVALPMTLPDLGAFPLPFAFFFTCVTVESSSSLSSLSSLSLPLLLLSPSESDLVEGLLERSAFAREALLVEVVVVVARTGLLPLEEVVFGALFET